MLSLPQKRKLISLLEDDHYRQDITTALLPRKKCSATIICKDGVVLAGAEEAAWLFRKNGLRVKQLKKDGSRLRRKAAVMVIEGDNRAIISAERTALNVLGRMSAVATTCSRARRIVGSGTKLLLTRKTMPGFSIFDKKACRYGGVMPHRFDLSEMFLIKNNHLKFGSITDLVKKARKRIGRAVIKKVEVEVRNLKQAFEAAEAGADIIMLDNFAPGNAAAVVKEIRRKCGAEIELSGGITLGKLKKYAKAGADFISMGALTKNSGMADFYLKIEKKGRRS